MYIWPAHRWSSQEKQWAVITKTVHIVHRASHASYKNITCDFGLVCSHSTRMHVFNIEIYPTNISHMVTEVEPFMNNDAIGNQRACNITWSSCFVIEKYSPLPLAQTREDYDRNKATNPFPSDAVRLSNSDMMSHLLLSTSHSVFVTLSGWTSLFTEIWFMRQRIGWPGFQRFRLKKRYGK